MNGIKKSKMQKIVVNKCYGGFGLSYKAYQRLRELGSPIALDEPDVGEYYSDGSGPRGDIYMDVFTKHYPDLSKEELIDKIRNEDSWCGDIERNDPLLIQVIEEIGEEDCSYKLAELRILEIPDDVDWEIQEYDGNEWIAEKHRTWH